MSIPKEELQKPKEKVEKITISEISIGTHLDQINPICTLSFKDSKDRGFQFKTSNLKFTIRMQEKDYYNFIDTLVSEVIDELHELEDPRFDTGYIEGLQDDLIAKFNGDL